MENSNYQFPFNSPGDLDVFTKSFLEKMRQERLKNGLSQANIAFDLGISIRTYSKIERREIRLSLERYLHWCYLLKVNALEFLKEALENK